MLTLRVMVVRKKAPTLELLFRDQKKRFESLGLDRDCPKVFNLVQHQGLNPEDPNLSEHYWLFGCLSESFTGVERVLEIGTEQGKFTSFLSDIFSDSTVISIDLPLDSGMNELYGRHDGKAYRAIQKLNVGGKANVSLCDLNSVALTGAGISPFNLIWIDGDHSQPVVSIDIINSIWLLAQNGLIIVDDVIPRPPTRETPMQSIGALTTLTALETSGVISTPLFVRKRLSPKNNRSSNTKWIAVARRAERGLDLACMK